MSLPDFVIPVLVFILVVIRIYFSKELWYKKENVWEIVIGIFVMGFSIWVSVQTSETTGTLNSSMGKLLEQRTHDSINNANFQKYLKDSLGIDRKGNIPVIVNRTIYNTFHEEKPKQNGLPDSLNYFFKISKDTFFVAPRQGSWAKPIVLFDTSVHPHLDMGYGNISPRKIKIENKNYTLDFSMAWTEVPSIEEPYRVMVDKIKFKFLIFGDDANRNKRYIYENGKVRWIPEIYPSQ